MLSSCVTHAYELKHWTLFLEWGLWTSSPACILHMVGGLLPGDKTSSGNKGENLELSVENFLSLSIYLS